MKSRTIIALAAALTLQISCLFAEPNYIEIKSISDATCIGIKSLEDFENLINQNNVAAVFLLSAGGRTDDLAYSTFYNYKTQGYDRNISAKIASYIAYINIGNTYFSFNLGNYKKISDYKEGKALGFENGTEYYEARNLNLLNLELYQYYKKNTFKSSEDCAEAKKNNFPTSDEYYAAKEKGYDSYADYKDYLVWNGKGYKSKEEWLKAKGKGFSNYNAKDFYDAQANGFATADDCQKAHELGFTKNDELKTYNSVTNDLEQIAKEKGMDRKQSAMYYFIKKLQKGSYSLRVLSASLKDIFYQSDDATRKTIEFFIDNDKARTLERHIEPKRRSERYRYESNLSPITDDELFPENELNAFIERVDIKELGEFNKEKGNFIKK